MTPVIFSCATCRRKYAEPVDPCPYCTHPGPPVKGTGDWAHSCTKLLGHVAVTPHLELCRYCGATQ
jgi:hypothetical protein